MKTGRKVRVRCKKKIRWPVDRGWQLDKNGNPFIVVGPYMIWLFQNEISKEFDCTVDTIDKNGTFTSNVEWVSYRTMEDAVACGRRLLKKYCAVVY